ncbi:hypothetical protein [Vibrio atlanticus]|uniref:hypothetical protein n=1 Tax=Vibrio atlanticus TaxID=693153 RepID=UPI003551C3F4
MNNNFAAIGQLVTEARNLLDSIKGGAIRTMQTQLNDKLTAVSGELNTFVNQEKGKVASIFSNPDSRYQKIQPVNFTIGGDKNKFYPVVFGSTDVNRLTEIHIGRFVHADGHGKGAMYAKFIASSFAWGGRSSTMVLDVLKTLTTGQHTEQNVKYDGFIASYSGSNLHPNGVVLWLRGGYSYEAQVVGTDLNRVDITTSKTQQVGKSNALIYLNGYEHTISGSLQTLPVRTTRDTTLIPNFTNYEKA